MADRISGPDRRELLAGLGAALIGLPSRAAAAPGPVLALQARADALDLRPGPPPAALPSLAATPGDLRFRRGDALQIQLGNETAAPIALNWHGLDGVSASEPLLARSPVAPQGKDSLAIPLRHAGTFLCDMRLLGDSQAPASAARALIVAESETG